MCGAKQWARASGTRPNLCLETNVSNGAFARGKAWSHRCAGAKQARAARRHATQRDERLTERLRDVVRSDGRAPGTRPNLCLETNVSNGAFARGKAWSHRCAGAKQARAARRHATQRDERLTERLRDVVRSDGRAPGTRPNLCLETNVSNGAFARGKAWSHRYGARIERDGHSGAAVHGCEQAASRSAQGSG